MVVDRVIMEEDSARHFHRPDAAAGARPDRPLVFFRIHRHQDLLLIDAVLDQSFKDIDRIFQAITPLHDLGHGVHEGIVTGPLEAEVRSDLLRFLVQFIAVEIETGKRAHHVGRLVDRHEFRGRIIAHLFLDHRKIILGVDKLFAVDVDLPVIKRVLLIARQRHILPLAFERRQRKLFEELDRLGVI